MALDIHFNDTPLGHEIRGVDLNNLDEQTFKDIDDAYKTYGVVVIRDQKLTPDQHATELIWPEGLRNPMRIGGPLTRANLPKRAVLRS